MKIYKLSLIIWGIIITCVTIIVFIYSLMKIVAGDYEYEGYIMFIAVLNIFLVWYCPKLFAKIYMLRFYKRKNFFGMKKKEVTNLINRSIMSSTFYFSVCEYFQRDFEPTIIESENLYFTIYENDKWIIYYDPLIKFENILKEIENG